MHNQRRQVGAAWPQSVEELLVADFLRGVALVGADVSPAVDVHHLLPVLLLVLILVLLLFLVLSLLLLLLLRPLLPVLLPLSSSPPSRSERRP